MKTIKNVKYSDVNHDGVNISFDDNNTFSIPTQQHRYEYTDALNEWLKKGNEIEAYQTDDKKLVLKKEQKTQEINELCKQSIEAGFISDALEKNCLYQSEFADQLNLMSVLNIGLAQKLKCSSNEGQTWQWLEHTKTQLEKVFADATKCKTMLLEKATDLKEKTKKCTTLEEVQNIKW